MSLNTRVATATTVDELPPGPGGVRPLRVASFLLWPTSFLERCNRRYGDYFTLRLSADRTFVITSDPEAVRTIFTGDPARLLAGRGNEILRPLLGDRSVLLLDGDEHLRQRRLLLPPFHGERMKSYGETMREVAERHIAAWPRGERFPTQPAMQAITLEVILRTVFGIDDAAEVERVGAPLRRLLDATASRLRLIALQVTSSEDPHPASPWGRLMRLREDADAVIYEQIEARRRAGDDGHADVLSLLLAARDEDGNPMSDVELRDELMTLLLAGHETTATALSWTLERVARHPEVLRRLYAEAGDEDGAYLDAVIHESLRLRPVVPGVGRYLTEPLEVGGRVIPAGVHFNPSIYLLHRRPDLYPEPERFRPERFLDRKPGTYEWIPFGGGVRRCLGASFALFEMRIVLRAILESVRLAPLPDPGEGVTRRAITFAPSRGGEAVVHPLA